MSKTAVIFLSGVVALLFYGNTVAKNETLSARQLGLAAFVLASVVVAAVTGIILFAVNIADYLRLTAHPVAQKKARNNALAFATGLLLLAIPQLL